MGDRLQLWPEGAQWSRCIPFKLFHTCMNAHLLLLCVSREVFDQSSIASPQRACGRVGANEIFSQHSTVRVVRRSGPE